MPSDSYHLMHTYRSTITSSRLLQVFEDTVSVNRKRHQDWFDMTITQCSVLEEKKTAHGEVNNNTSSTSLRERIIPGMQHSDPLCGNGRCRCKTSDGREKLHAEIQLFADMSNAHRFCEAAVKPVYGPSRNSTHSVWSADGRELIRDKQQILNSRCVEHCSELLNHRMLNTEPSKLKSLDV